MMGELFHSCDPITLAFNPDDEMEIQMIQFKLVTITPAIAAEYLLCNDEDNRNKRPRATREYAKDMADGNWRLTHQPIAFDSDGKLVDGQHRLQAVIDSGVTIDMFVAHYSSREEAMNLPIDRNARRTIADILHKDKRSVEVATYLADVVAAGHGAASIHEVDTTFKTIEKMITLLHDTCGTVAKVRSSCSVRAAVVCHMMSNPKMAQSIADSYRSFILQNYDDCNPSIKAFLKLLGGVGLKSSADRTEMFSRSMKAFDPHNTDSKVNRFGDRQKEMHVARFYTLRALGLLNAV